MFVEIGQSCIGELLAYTILGEGVADTRKFIRIHRLAAYEEVVAQSHRVLVENAVSGETVVKCGSSGLYLIEILEGEQLLKRNGSCVRFRDFRLGSLVSGCILVIFGCFAGILALGFA